MRVLIIDDHPDPSYVVSLLVKQLGHDAMLLSAPETAAGVAKVYKPELVFVDLAMPGMDGYEVARQIREHAGLNGARILALSAHSGDAEKERAAGIDGHILKPITAAQLTKLLGDGHETSTGFRIHQSPLQDSWPTGSDCGISLDRR